MGVTALVVGNGGREHAIAWALAKSPRVGRVVVAPGNGGWPDADRLPIRPTDIAGQVAAAKAIEADLVVVGPEVALEAGLVDALRAEGIPTFGPTKAAARIESSKAFAKSLMREAGVPTADSVVCADLDSALEALNARGAPIVVKADGLAAGKGVVVAETIAEAETAIRDCFERRVFGAAGQTVVLETKMTGREVSLLCFVDGRAVLPLPPACDYKPAFDGDRGPNTGGMGAYSSPPWFGPAAIDWAARHIVQPTVDALAAHGAPFRGCLYAGLMVTSDGPKVVEFNARFGDPEAQTLLPLLTDDFYDLAVAVAHGDLRGASASFGAQRAVTVVLASGGYPGAYRTGAPIHGLDAIPANTLVFHAGVRRERDQFFTDGGRVLNVVGVAETTAAARNRAYHGVAALHFDDMHYRADIALRELEAGCD